MRIEQLDYLAAVTRLGSLRRAAEELHISQPALSETVRNLERELGVTLLDRKRSGATISAGGSELLPHIMGVLDAVDRLRAATDHQVQSARLVRIGTVNAATSPLLAPSLAAFRSEHAATQVEIFPAQQHDIHRLLAEGGLDLGLINILSGDDLPLGLENTRLLRGRVVVCVRTDSPLAGLDVVRPTDLLMHPLIVMRSGYLMHRFVNRLFNGEVPAFAYSTDGAELGKLMVAEGLGVTLLPDYSVAGDPLERRGVITTRPLVHDDTEVFLVLQRRPSISTSPAVDALHRGLVKRARAFGEPQPAPPSPRPRTTAVSS